MASRTRARSPPDSVDQRRSCKVASSESRRDLVDHAFGHAACPLSAQTNEVGDREVPVRLEILRQVTDLSRPNRPGEARQILTANSNLSCCRRQDAGKHFQQHRLTGAVGSHDGNRTGWTERERYPGKQARATASQEQTVG